MDVGEVLSHAEAFANAVVGNDMDLTASYLNVDLEARVSDDLETLGGTEQAEVQVVLPLCDDENDPLAANQFMAVTCFWAPDESFLVRAVWVQSPHQLLIKRMQIVERAAASHSG